LSHFDQTYYDEFLRETHDALRNHEIAQQHLSGEGIRFDGVDLTPDSDLDFEGAPKIPFQVWNLHICLEFTTLVESMHSPNIITPWMMPHQGFISLLLTPF